MTSAKPSSRATTELNDVFVIGAGASVPYGFPTGAKLLSLLREEQLDYHDGVLLEILADIEQCKLFDYAQADPVFADEQWNYSQERGLCSGWSRKLRGSVILTIDQFLKNLVRDKYRDLGKRLMARQILGAEESACKGQLERIDAKPAFSMHYVDWIQEFLTRVDLLENWHEYLLKTIFLTFNYDRVLEFFLTRYLVVDRHQSEANAASFVKSMRILHLNGYLGELEEIPFGNLRPESGTIGEFDALFDLPSKRRVPVDWSAVAERMRTVWENPKDHANASETQAKAKAATSKAKRIFVIGTSFIPENLEAIGLISQPGSGQPKAWGANLLATASGLSVAQVNRAANFLQIPHDVAGIHFFNKNAQDFVVDHVVL